MSTGSTYSTGVPRGRSALGRPERIDRARVAALGVIVVAAAIRIPTLGQQSFWTDEAATLSVLHHSLGGIFPAIARQESTPPLYYLVAWLWTQLFGYSEFALRFPSALAGIGAVWIVSAAAAELGGPRVGRVAGLLAAVNPLLVWYSQEARAYSLLALLCAASFLMVIRCAKRDFGSRREQWGWAAVAGLALCTHYFAIFVVAPEAVWLLVRSRRRAWPQAGAVGVVALAWLPLALHQRSSGRTDWITGTALRTRAALIPKQFVTGLSAPHQTVLAVAGLLAAAIALGVLVRHRREVSAEALLAGGILLGAPILMVLLAVAGVDLVLTRNAIGIVPLGLLAVAVGVDHCGKRVALALIGVLVAVGAFAIVGVDTDATYQRTDWRAVGRALRQDRATQLLILDPASSRLPLGVYVRLEPVDPARAAVRRLDVVQFLLNDQGAPAGRGAPHAPRGFRRVALSEWPGLRLTEFASSRPRVVHDPIAGAAGLLIPAR